MKADKHDYFDAMYGASADPYALRTRWYEQRKRDLLLAALPARRYRSAYEPGCGVGELTLALAARCDALLACDMSERAVATARRRCGGLSNVRIAQHTLPADWPSDAGCFDLIVLSELGYFLDAASMRELTLRCGASLAADGTLVACDWRPDFEQRALATDAVQATLAELGLARLLRHEEDDFLLQVWSRDGRSVAQREGDPVIGIVIPAHDEAEHIDAALAAVMRAAAHAALCGEEVAVVVVLDSCSDATGSIALQYGVLTISVAARNVGMARAAGAQLLLDAGARWLAFTDADTRVSSDWLVEQLALQVEVVCGCVAVDDWSAHGPHGEFVRAHFASSYTDADGHRHVHGANLGVCAAAYRRVGGFAPLACSEDVALVAALQAAGARIAWSAAPRVSTSARTDARARGGFGDALLTVVAALAVVADPS